MGDVVNDASHLAGYGSKGAGDRPIMISSVFHDNLNEANKAFLAYNTARGCFHGDVVNVPMDN
jgi:hypothetical protein